MKKIYLWAGTVILALAFSLTGISCSREQAKEKASAKAPEQAALPAPKEAVPGQTMLPPDHGKMPEKPETAGNIPAQNAVIARVNGTDITMNDLSSEMKMIGPQVISDAAQRTPENVRKLRKMALDILIFRELATQEAARQGLKVRKEAVDEADRQLRIKLGSDDNYRKFLQMSGYTEGAMRKRLEKDLLFEMITDQEIFKKAGSNDQAAIEKRKEAWENSLKKTAKVELLSPEVEKEYKEEARKEK